MMETKKENVPVLRISSDVALPDKGVWTNRFEIESATSNNVYTISQHKDKKHWGCSCPAWITRRQCKHLSSLRIPGGEIPYEPKIIKQ